MARPGIIMPAMAAQEPTRRDDAGTTSLLRRHWFLIGLGLALLLAWPLARVPQLVTGSGGSAAKQGLVALVFLASGLAMPGEALLGAGRRWPVHLGIQAISLLLIPVTVWALRPLWLAILGDGLLVDGLLVVACLPTTITSCVVFTRSAGGDEALALVNAVLGNLLGIVVAPLALLLLLGLDSDVPWPDLLGRLALLTALPLALGQALRRRLRPGRIAAARLGITMQVALLLIIALALAGSLHGGGLPDGERLLLLLGACLLLRLLLIGLSWPLAHLLGRDRREACAIFFCAGEKTLALGVPLLSVAFAGDPRLGPLLMPLLCYHPLQLVVDALIAARLAGRSSG